ncbi:hypothetical protein [Rhodoferax sp.]|uniref:hypothetical protein n=1 Tax=Rhodoferax sp. TaxID=50421 RepID=UPI0025F6CE17|nr:hypothetical protein [Rhodoferax sp.]
MSPSALLSQVTNPTQIRAYFDWHLEQGVYLMLMIASSDAHTMARMTGFEAADGSLQVVCTGVRDVTVRSDTPYAMIGRTPSGANFLASGTMRARAGTSDCFSLSFPAWIDVSQARDSYRSPAPAGHFLHFSSPDPHLNDIVCRVQNVSLGGLAVEWDLRYRNDLPALNKISEDSILQSGNNRISLGKLRVAHITKSGHQIQLGLTFDRDAPREFGSLVLDAQRSHYLA